MHRYCYNFKNRNKWKITRIQRVRGGKLHLLETNLPKWYGHGNYPWIHRAGVMVKRGQSPWEVVKVRTRSNNWNKGLEAWRWFPKKFRPSVSNVQAMSRSRGSVLCRGDLRYQKFLFFPPWENRLPSISWVLRLWLFPLPSARGGFVPFHHSEVLLVRVTSLIDWRLGCKYHFTL